MAIPRRDRPVPEERMQDEVIDPPIPGRFKDPEGLKDAAGRVIHPGGEMRLLGSRSTTPIVDPYDRPAGEERWKDKGYKRTKG